MNITIEQTVGHKLRGKICAEILNHKIMCQLTSFIALSLLQYRSYKIRRDNDGYYPFIFNDMMGSEQKANQGIHTEDVKLALRGHVKEGYKVQSSVF